MVTQVIKQLILFQCKSNFQRDKCIEVLFQLISFQQLIISYFTKGIVVCDFGRIIIQIIYYIYNLSSKKNILKQLQFLKLNLFFFLTQINVF
ncbi:hypothetical protein pb186bvf_010779 [Paramecium bursaria]